MSLFLQNRNNHTVGHGNTLIILNLLPWLYEHRNLRSIAYCMFELEISKNSQELHLISHLTEITA